MITFRLILLEPVEPFRSELAATIRQATALPSLRLDERDALPALIRALDSSDTPYDTAIVSLDSAPNQNAVVDVGTLKARFPSTSFIVYSASDRLVTAQQAHASGAAGYFRRDSPPELILQVLSIVLGGEAFALPDHLRPVRSSCSTRSRLAGLATAVVTGT